MNNFDIVSLPINVNPIIRSYRVHSYLINIMENIYPDFEKYVISNYLCLHNGKKNIRMEYLDFHLDNNFLSIRELFRNNSWFDVVQISDCNCQDNRKQIETRDLIVEFLNRGYYVLHGVNESCLSHTVRYGKPVSNNIAMTYGYNYKRNTFFLLDYNNKGRYGPSEVSYEEYFNSLKTVTIDNRLNFIKAKNGLVFNFDFERSIKLLKCHVHSQNAYQNHDDYMNNVFGYEGVERSLEEMQKTGINLVRMRVIMEHKNTVLSCLRYASDNNLIDVNIVKYYNEINKKMHTIFMKIFKKAFVCKDNVNYSDDFDDIRLLNENEETLMKKFLQV